MISRRFHDAPRPAVLLYKLRRLLVRRWTPAALLALLRLPATKFLHHFSFEFGAHLLPRKAQRDIVLGHAFRSRAEVEVEHLAQPPRVDRDARLDELQHLQLIAGLRDLVGGVRDDAGG